MNSTDIRKEFKKAVAKCGNQSRFASLHGLSRAYVSDIFNGRREISQTIAQILGYEMEIEYKRIESFRKIK